MGSCCLVSSKKKNLSNPHSNPLQLPIHLVVSTNSSLVVAIPSLEKEASCFENISGASNPNPSQLNNEGRRWSLLLKEIPPSAGCEELFYFEPEFLGDVGY
ncbi:hypothetical protein IFM89_032786 [Coptis chinensis]|uniref:Uncharacterized protein n=1 Tax=Coptis chinensis TaxID=261450 RepID=A0A835IZ01_9MAGN|nr:hypothetical protein IFM89_032786 [Coptis chinensis]